LAAGELLAGCAGDGSGLDSSGRPLSEGSSSLALSADFNSIQANVFSPICSACHAGATAPQGLRLDAGNSYALLVGIPSNEVPSVLRVKPGDPDNSYLIQKLEGHARVGAQMPFGGPPLPATTIAFIRQWILNGAQRPAAALVPTIPQMMVASSFPANGDVLDAPPARLVISMTEPLAVNRVDTSSVRLERLVPTTGDGAPVDIASAVAVPLANPQSIVVTPLEPLTAGSYRLVFNGLPGNELLSIGGDALMGLEADDAGDWLVTRFVVQVAP
jgi:hypothetical protein